MNRCACCQGFPMVPSVLQTWWRWKEGRRGREMINKRGSYSKWRLEKKTWTRHQTLAFIILIVATKMWPPHLGRLSPASSAHAPMYSHVYTHMAKTHAHTHPPLSVSPSSTPSSQSPPDLKATVPPFLEPPPPSHLGSFWSLLPVQFPLRKLNWGLLDWEDPGLNWFFLPQSSCNWCPCLCPLTDPALVVCLPF